MKNSKTTILFSLIFILFMSYIFRNDIENTINPNKELYRVTDGIVDYIRNNDVNMYKSGSEYQVFTEKMQYKISIEDKKIIVKLEKFMGLSERDDLVEDIKKHYYGNKEGTVKSVYSLWDEIIIDCRDQIDFERAEMMNEKIIKNFERVNQNNIKIIDSEKTREIMDSILNKEYYTVH